MSISRRTGQGRPTSKAVQQLVELWELLRNQALSAGESLDWLSELSGKK